MGTEVTSGDVAEGHTRAQRSAGAAVRLAQHRRHGVTRRVKAWDRVSVPIQHLGVAVSLRTAGSAQSAGFHLDRVVGALIDHTQGAVWGIECWIAPHIEIVVAIVATIEVVVMALADHVIEPRHGDLQAFAVDPRLCGQFFQNNHYSEHTGVDYAVGTARDIASRAEAFGMQAWRADGTDFFAVHETMRDVLEHVRCGNGPAAIEFDTERFFGHFEGDPQRYRGKGEIERIRETRDCLKKFREKVVGAKLLSDADLDALDTDVLQSIDAAVEAARAAARPTPEDVLADVYISY